MNTVLFGVKASGKSTVGRALAHKRNQDFIDTDSMVQSLYEEQFGQSLLCTYIYREHGEAFFRSLEQQVVCRLSEAKDAVIAVGGSTLLNRENVRILKDNSKFALLSLSLPHFFLRIRHLPDRPALFNEREDNQHELLSYYHQRMAVYPDLADCVCIVDGLKISEIICELEGSC